MARRSDASGRPALAVQVAACLADLGTWCSLGVVEGIGLAALAVVVAAAEAGTDLAYRPEAVADRTRRTAECSGVGFDRARQCGPVRRLGFVH